MTASVSAVKSSRDTAPGANQAGGNARAEILEALRDGKLPEIVVERDSKKFSREAGSMLALFSALTAGVIALWIFWDPEWLAHDDDLIYNLGLIGGIAMLFQFGYSLRKRLSSMRDKGHLKYWFLVHLIIGIGAPLIIIVHSRFDISSINGGVAFFSMLMVVLSGVVGRYLYSQVSFDLAMVRERLRLQHQVLVNDVLLPRPGVAPQMEEELKLFMVAAFRTPSTFTQAFWHASQVGLRSRLLYLRLIQMEPSRSQVQDGQLALSMAVNGELFSAKEKRVLREYLQTLNRLARFHAYKRLFAMWRVGHVPVIFLLLISGLAHVLAVHMY